MKVARKLFIVLLNVVFISVSTTRAQGCYMELDTSSSFSANTFSHVLGTAQVLPCPVEDYLDDAATMIAPSILFGGDLLGYSHAALTKNAFLCPTGSEGDAFVKISGSGGNSVSLVWDVRADAEMDCYDKICGYFARGYAHMDATLDLNFNVPPNNVGFLVYSYSMYSAIGNRPEAVDEDTAYVTGVTLMLDTANLLPGNFDMPQGTYGRYVGKSLSGQLGFMYIGGGGATSLTISATSYASIFPPARPPGLSEHEDGAWAEYYGYMDLVLICVDTSTQPIPTNIPDSLLARICPGEDIFFSVDLGGDTELSDPAADGNEAFDPGDIYKYQGNSASGSLAVNDSLVLGLDPVPNSALPAPVCGINNGSKTDIASWSYFDIDASDRINIDLASEIIGPGQSVAYRPGFCIFQPRFMILSFDEDPFGSFIGEVFGCDVPTQAPILLGRASEHDEVLTAVASVNPTTGQISYLPGPLYSESELHNGLLPNPDTNAVGRLANDDVDALDAYSDTAQCNYQYFSVDHEARYIVGNDTLRAGVIYEANLANHTIQAVVDPVLHLGLSDRVDIDAFEFAWMHNPASNSIALALVFSVDGDDFNTVSSEADTLDPGILYASFMDGSFFRFSDSRVIWEDDIGPFRADIDALAFTCFAVPGPGVTVFPPTLPVGINTGHGTNGALEMTVYPNPTTGSIIVDYVLPEAGAVTISMIDLSGREVYSHSLGAQPPGQQQYQLHADEAGLNNGIYLVRIGLDNGAGNKYIHRKVVIQQ